MPTLTQTTKPELLAPAGDWEALRAGVANGADAVYLGLSNFNARHRAANFTLEELPDVMAFLHSHNVKGFITFNTLIFSDELEEAANFAKKIAEAGADAVIVQDLGLVRLLHRLAPDLHIHGSTQMTLTEPRGIGFVKRLGVSRVVLARELSVRDIARITASNTLPVEVFVHGALCVAYSGQCLTSESLGGRSANRGQCAQACRLPYDLMVDGEKRDLGDKAYLLSPQDLAAYDIVGELVKEGVISFKIEGRLKSAHYVAATTQAYRTAIDSAISAQPFSITPQQKLDLQQSFSRGFTHGFLDGVDHQELVPARFPKSRGVKIGTVIGTTAEGVVIEMNAAVLPGVRGSIGGSTNQNSAIGASGSRPIINPGDGVVFDEGHPEQDEQGGRVFYVRSLNTKPPAPARFEVQFGPGDVNLQAVALGATVWKTDDPALKKRLEQSYSRDTLAKRTRLDMTLRAVVGEHLRLDVRDADGLEAESEWIEKTLEAAQKHPVSIESAKQQLERLGDTPYELGSITLDGGPGVPPGTSKAMVPKSVLNELRRHAVDELLALREKKAKLNVADPDALANLRAEAEKGVRHLISDPASDHLYILVRSLEQLASVLAWRGTDDLPASLRRPATVYCDFEDIRKYKDAVAMANAAAQPIGLATVRIIKPGEEGLCRLVGQCNPDAVLVRSLAALELFREEFPALPLITDYSLNVSNELTANLMLDSGAKRITPSYDLNWKQMSAMFARFPAVYFETVVHQHMPMFHMEHCVFAATLSNGKDYRDCGRPCETHKVELRDRVGQAHPLMADVGCRNTVYNAQAQTGAEYIPRMKALGLRHFRVELARETPEQATMVLERYARVIAGLEEAREVKRSLYVLSQLGVTAGTLERE